MAGRDNHDCGCSRWTDLQGLFGTTTRATVFSAFWVRSALPSSQKSCPEYSLPWRRVRRRSPVSIVKGFEEKGNRVVGVVGARTGSLLVFEKELAALCDSFLVIPRMAAEGSRVLPRTE